MNVLQILNHIQGEKKVADLGTVLSSNSDNFTSQRTSDLIPAAQASLTTSTLSMKVSTFKAQRVNEQVCFSFLGKKSGTEAFH